MSTRPTEPGNYHWRASKDHKWRTIEVFKDLIDNIRDDYGEWGPRIPDPDEPTGGLTDFEIVAGAQEYFARPGEPPHVRVAVFRRAVAELREGGK